MIQLRIKEILKEKGMPVSELARRLGKTQPYVSNIINGHQGASVNTLRMIAEELNVPVATLFADYKEALEREKE